jgi:tetratricopeptide (TPR) repeat protein
MDIVKPKGNSEISFLLVKQAALRLLTDSGDDLAELKRAVERRDSSAVAALVVNRGRSWIETTEAAEAMTIFETIAQVFQPNSIEVVWTQYLSAIALLFRDRSAPAEAFDDRFLQRAEPHGLKPLVLAERMEFARKRNDPQTLAMAAELKAAIEPNAIATDQIHSYVLGVAFFLLGNLLRAGGRYEEATEAIARARSFYRPSILAHQIELAHCHYALAVCRAIVGGSFTEDLPAISLGPELRRFVDALRTLTRSHSAWSKNELGEAIQHAETASLIFQQIRFVEYGRRAQSLTTLLGAWRRLELGAAPDQVSSQVGDESLRLAAMLGNKDFIPSLLAWIRCARPSRVIGMLQFASAYNPNWTDNVGRFELPPVLEQDADRLQWKRESCYSLAEADAKLRQLMGITHDGRLPLIAD